MSEIGAWQRWNEGLRKDLKENVQEHWRIRKNNGQSCLRRIPCDISCDSADMTARLEDHRYLWTLDWVLWIARNTNKWILDQLKPELSPEAQLTRLIGTVHWRTPLYLEWKAKIEGMTRNKLGGCSRSSNEHVFIKAKEPIRRQNILEACHLPGYQDSKSNWQHLIKIVSKQIRGILP